MKTSKNILNNESGATIIYVGLIIVVLMMFTALAVDIGHLYGVRNELQDAADAGALAGASVLFDKDTCELRADEAIDEATRVTQLNTTGNVSVVAKSVHVGHWSFHRPSPDGHVFTADLNDPHVQIEWKEQSTSELDADTGYINAVEVVTERTDTPSFFANFFGFDQFLVSTKAVAYRGFAGSFSPGEFDQPIAICEEAITSIDAEGNKSYDCNMGRMINSGNDTGTSNTAAWTNLTQPCSGAANPTDVRPLVCSGNTTDVDVGYEMGTTGGQDQTIFAKLLECWKEETNQRKNWPLTLPVIQCPGNNVGPCTKVVGAVNLNIIWMIEKISESAQNKYDDVPRYMETWGVDEHNNPVLLDTYSNPVELQPDNFEAWKDFVDNFKLANVDGPPENRDDDAAYSEMYQHKAIFFLPKCEIGKATGGTGGQNFGVCARRPVLVQ